MNIFFVEPADVIGNHIELKGQEATHANKVLRYEVGATIYAADGLGNRYHAEITQIAKNSLFAEIKKVESQDKPTVKKVIAFGAIKKRDRLEFAVEKAVELDAWEICIFHADHSERSKINQERLQTIALSAFKQSKRFWFPKIVYLDSLDEVFNHYQDFKPVLAHMKSEVVKPGDLPDKNNVLMVGPEGGFSDREVNLAKSNKAELISLGKTRLRAETAVAAFLSLYLFS